MKETEIKCGDFLYSQGFKILSLWRQINLLVAGCESILKARQSIACVINDTLLDCGRLFTFFGMI